MIRKRVTCNTIKRHLHDDCPYDLSAAHQSQPPNLGFGFGCTGAGGGANWAFFMPFPTPASSTLCASLPRSTTCHQTDERRKAAATFYKQGTALEAYLLMCRQGARRWSQGKVTGNQLPSRRAPLNSVRSGLLQTKVSKSMQLPVQFVDKLLPLDTHISLPPTNQPQRGPSKEY